MYYLKNGVKSKLLAVLFAMFCILSSFGMGNMTQSNTVAQAIESTFGIDRIIVGVIISIVVSLIIIGGVKRIVTFTSFFIPLMSAVYMLFAIVVLVYKRENIIDAFGLIFSSAFSFEKVGAGVMGYTISRGIRFGIARGIFSNEAGLGSAPIVHAAAENDSPVKQGMWGIFEVFFDTIVTCTMTALVILTTDAHNVLGTNGLKLDGIDLTNEAFSQIFGFSADIFLTISIIFFAVATIICWSYYGECCIKFLTKPKKEKNAVLMYKILFIVCIVVGTVAKLDTVWLLSDIFNALMAVPNLIAILILYKDVLNEVKKFRF